nr:MAG TPA: DNA polymerase [Caudoviricetes sp.]
MLNFYDFEVFKHDWMVVVINPVTHDERVIINDADALTALYEGHKREIWVGYNNLHYDQFIFKGILCGFDPKAINDFIIVEGHKGWQYSSLLRKVYMVNYDVFHPRTDRGLKTHEAYLGNDICETTVPFDIDRKLTEAEIAETVKYCRHDVEQTIEVFMQRKSEFDARMDLLKMFSLPLVYLGKTDAQLTAIILGAERPARPRDDEFDIVPLPCLDLGPYDFIRLWYLDPANQDYSATLDFDIAGCPHKCAWGGLHGALTQYAGEGYFINVDVESYYPAEMIAHALLSRNVQDPSKFKGIRDHRIELKHAKDPRQKALKLVVNGTYGASKDKFNALYDPRQANMVCVNGQLMLIDLMHKLVRDVGAEIIQSNTDGVLIRMPDGFDGGPDAFYDRVDDVAYEWEHRTGMGLEFDEFTRVYQKDVNNYVLVAADGSMKTKGAYVKKLGPLDYDLAVVNKALVEFMVHGVPVEDTIAADDDLIDYQRVVKVSGKYKYGVHGHERLTDRCFRVFASIRESDGMIGRVKAGKAKPEKFGNTSEHSFIDNGDVHGKKCPGYLDKSWYIQLAKTRLAQFGVM